MPSDSPAAALLFLAPPPLFSPRPPAHSTSPRCRRARRSIVCGAAPDAGGGGDGGGGDDGGAMRADGVAGKRSAGKGRGRAGSKKAGSSGRRRGQGIVVAGRTRADFAAEGVVDEVPAGGVRYGEKADIRFGVRDLVDPFLQDDQGGGEGAPGAPLDLSGDGGVVKTVQSAGGGPRVEPGAEVVVAYEGRLSASGKVFDASRARGDAGFKFALGAGKVIKGWDLGVASMRVGEKAQLTIAPKYAYGTRGVPPVIPPKATLIFDIEVLSAAKAQPQSQDKVPAKMSDYFPDVPRTPTAISEAYEEKMKTSEERKAKMTFFDKFYIISPFASQTGERPPWFLNPNITFVLVFAIVGGAFYLVYLAGGVHQGYVQDSVDVNIFK